MGVNLGVARQDTQGKLFPAHLQAENAHRGALLGGVQGYVNRQGALAQAGPGAQDKHIRPLHTAQQFIQIVVAGHYRGAVIQRVADGSPFLQELVINLPQGDKAPVRSVGPHLKEHVLGLAQRGLHVVRVSVTDGGDAGGGVYQPAHNGGVRHHLGIVFGVDGGRGGRNQVAEIGHAAGVFQLVGAAQLPGQSHLVNGLAALEQVGAGGETEAVALPVKVVRRD